MAPPKRLGPNEILTSRRALNGVLPGAASSGIGPELARFREAALVRDVSRPAPIRHGHEDNHTVRRELALLRADFRQEVTS